MYEVNSTSLSSSGVIPANGQIVNFTNITKDDNRHTCQKGGSKFTAQAKSRARIVNIVKDEHHLSVQIAELAIFLSIRSKFIC